MKKKIADQWVAALRSGEYAQGKNALRNSKNEFCCLGVLCNLHAQSHPGIAAGQRDPRKYLGEYGRLSALVMDWAGIRNNLGSVDVGCPQKTVNGRVTLAAANDSGARFLTIADFIEKNYEYL